MASSTLQRLCLIVNSRCVVEKFEWEVSYAKHFQCSLTDLKGRSCTASFTFNEQVHSLFTADNSGVSWGR